MLGSYAYNFDYASLPPETIAKAKTLLMHDMGVGLAGHTGDTPQIAASAATRIYGSAGDGGAMATSFVLNRKVPLAHAVFANAALFHYRTQEDTHLGALAHFGPNIIPICLALGESLNKSGKEIIEAMVAGYQVGAAVGSVSAKETTARGFRASSIYGAFAGAVAGGKLLGLNEQQMQNAVSLAANFGMGLNETWVAGTMEYAIQIGMTAVNGLMAATLAKEGMEAAGSALDGRSGFYRAYAGMENVREQVEEALSVKYQIYAVTMKYYCCCALTQSPVTAVLNLLGKQPVKPEEIRHVNIRMNAAEAVYPGTMEKGPFRKFGGSLMSAPYCTAAALKFGTITMEGMTSFDDPVLNDLIANSDVIPDEKVGPLSCVIEIETKDGRTLTEALNVNAEFFNFSFQQDVEILRDMLPEMKFDKGQFEQLVGYISQFETLENVAVVAGHLGQPGRA
jgi:2-methylcitrate dehydratase PrpD